MLYLNDRFINNADYTISTLAEHFALNDYAEEIEKLSGNYVEAYEKVIITDIKDNKLRCHKLGKTPVAGDVLLCDDITFTKENVREWLVKYYPTWRPGFIFDNNTPNEENLCLDTALKCIGALCQVCCESSVKHEQPPFKNQDQLKETIVANHSDGLIRGLSPRNLDRYLKAGKDKVK